MAFKTGLGRLGILGCIVLCLCFGVGPCMSQFVRGDSEHLEQDVRRVTHELIGAPEDNPGEYKLKKMAIGTINFCYIVTTPNSKVVIRISRDHNTQHELSDRSKERKLLSVITERGVGVKLLAVFDNGHITQYVNGDHLTVKQMKKYYADVAKIVADLHNIELSEEKKQELDSSVWDRMEGWLVKAEKDLPKEEYDFFKKEIGELRAVLCTDEYSDKVLIHGDINHGNIIRDKETGTITLVDYEFSGYGERLFDLANHFCEWSGLDLEWDRYPTVTEQVQFLSVYVKHAFAGKDGNGCEVKLLQRKVGKYQLVSHMFWALWGKLMHAYRPDDPFYDPYSIKRKERYLDVKDKILNEPLYECQTAEKDGL